jgi:hypothetical protein
VRIEGSSRVRSFDEIDEALGGTGTVKQLEQRYLDVEDEDAVGAVKEYARKILQDRLDRYCNPRGIGDCFKNSVGYTKALIAKYGILVLAARRRMDKENPESLISMLEEKLKSYVEDAVRKLKLPNNVYTPWMSILSYPSVEVGDCHPWIMRFEDMLGGEVVESAKRVRAMIDLQRRIVLRKISNCFQGPKLKEFKQVLSRLQRIHFWSEKDEWEEDEDLALTNQVVDVFCPHMKEHRALRDIAECPSVRSYLAPGRLRKAILVTYILLDDHFSSGKSLRKTAKP